MAKAQAQFNALIKESEEYHELDLNLIKECKQFEETMKGLEEKKKQMEKRFSGSAQPTASNK